MPSFIVTDRGESTSSIRQHRDDGTERSVRAEIQLPSTNVHRDGLSVETGRASAEFQVCTGKGLMDIPA